MVASPRFSKGTPFVPVPAAMFGSLLETINDLNELKVVLRFLWHLTQVQTLSRGVSSGTLENDQVLLNVLGSPDAIRTAIGNAVTRGVLLELDPSANVATTEASYGLNANWYEGKDRGFSLRVSTDAIINGTPSDSGDLNIYSIYEENIGALTPLIAEGIKDAEKNYPDFWIKDAIRESVAYNKRSWRYIERILERWKKEGRGYESDGKPRGYSQTLTAAEYLQQYGLPDRKSDRY